MKVKCEKCGNYSIELIEDRELGCEVCLNEDLEAVKKFELKIKEMQK